jgi:hypothetical protein
MYSAFGNPFVQYFGYDREIVIGPVSCTNFHLQMSIYGYDPYGCHLKNCYRPHFMHELPLQMSTYGYN